MSSQDDHIPGVSDDPVLRLILDGRAANLHEAEEIYLDESRADILALIAGPLDNEALARHPLMRLLAAHGSLGDDEFDVEDAYPVMDEVARSEGWDDPELDIYNHLRGPRT